MQPKPLDNGERVKIQTVFLINHFKYLKGTFVEKCLKFIYGLKVKLIPSLIPTSPLKGHVQHPPSTGGLNNVQPLLPTGKMRL